MCLALVRPDGGPLEIPYFLENIFLRNEAKSFLTIDFFVRNPTSSPISNLHIVYPNPHFFYTKLKWRRKLQLALSDTREAATYRAGFFTDRTDTVADDPDREIYEKHDINEARII